MKRKPDDYDQFADFYDLAYDAWFDGADITLYSLFARRHCCDVLDMGQKQTSDMNTQRSSNPIWEKASGSQILRRLRDELMQMGRIKPPGLAVDMACGPAGTCALGFSPTCDKVIAYDISPETILKCQEAISAKSVNNVCASVHDLQSPWPLDDESVDLVTGVGAISNIDDPRKTLTEARRVLKRNGYLLLGDYCVPSEVHELWGVLSSLRYGRRRPYVAYSEYMDLLIESGFEVVEYRPLRWRYRMDEPLSRLSDEVKRAFLQAVRDMSPASRSVLHARFEGASLIVEHDCFALRASASGRHPSWLIDDTAPSPP